MSGRAIIPLFFSICSSHTVSCTQPKAIGPLDSRLVYLIANCTHHWKRYDHENYRDLSQILVQKLALHNFAPESDPSYQGNFKSFRKWCGYLQWHEMSETDLIPSLMWLQSFLWKSGCGITTNTARRGVVLKVFLFCPRHASLPIFLYPHAYTRGHRLQWQRIEIQSLTICLSYR